MSTMMTTGYLGTTASLNPDGSVRGDEANLPVVGRGTYVRTLLERAQPELLHQNFGQQKPLTKNSGQTVVFRRYEKLAQATTPLTEGVTPTGTALTKTDYTATVKQYGNFIPISDFVRLTHVDPILNETSGLMGENMGETMDSVYREVLVTGTNAYYVAQDASSGSGDTGHWLGSATTPKRTGVAGTVCKGVLDAVIRQLRSANAKPFTPMVTGSTKISSYPIGQSFWALMHTDLEHDLFRTANSGMTLGEEFTPVERYSGFQGSMMTEVGKYRNIRFVTSTNTKIWEDSGALLSGAGSGMKSTTGTSADVYAILIFARDAYGIVPLQRGSATVIIQPPGGNGDPLEQRTTVGWKAAGTAIVLNDSWMARVEVTSLA